MAACQSSCRRPQWRRPLRKPGRPRSRVRTGGAAWRSLDGAVDPVEPEPYLAVGGGAWIVAGALLLPAPLQRIRGVEAPKARELVGERRPEPLRIAGDLRKRDRRLGPV